jgi:hypothetical protein
MITPQKHDSSEAEPDLAWGSELPPGLGGTFRRMPVPPELIAWRVKPHRLTACPRCAGPVMRLRLATGPVAICFGCGDLQAVERATAWLSHACACGRTVKARKWHGRCPACQAAARKAADRDRKRLSRQVGPASAK